VHADFGAGCVRLRQRAADPASGRLSRGERPAGALNRGIFEVNQVVDKLLFKPAAEVYRTVLPPFVRASVRNMLDNMSEPVCWRTI